MEEELAYTVYWPTPWEVEGVPVIVPVNASNDNPAGRLGEMSQVISPTSISVAKSDAERTASYTYKSSRMPSSPSMLADGPMRSNSAPVDDVKAVPLEVR